MNTAEIKRENFINLYDENGKKHGVWEYYHDNGQLYYRGNYENGKKHGIWERYHDNGRLSSKGIYVYGKAHGVYESYYVNGELLCRKEYNMGKEVQLELTMDEIAEKFGVPVNQLKIKTT